MSSVRRASNFSRSGLIIRCPAVGRKPILSPAHRVAQVCDANALDHRRVAKNGWHAGEAVEESNSGAKKECRDVDVEFVEEPGIQALLDGVRAVDPDGLPGGGGFRLAYGALDAVGHEVDSRIGSRPSGGDLVGQYECRPPSVMAIPAMGDVGNSASSGRRGSTDKPPLRWRLPRRNGATIWRRGAAGDGSPVTEGNSHRRTR